MVNELNAPESFTLNGYAYVNFTSLNKVLDHKNTCKEFPQSSVFPYSFLPLLLLLLFVILNPHPRIYLLI